MKNREKVWEDLIVNALTLFGVMVLVRLILHSEDPLEQERVGIFGIKFRKVIAYEDRFGKKVFFNDLVSMPKSHQVATLALLRRISYMSEIPNGVYVLFKGDTILSGEFKKDEIRVLVHKIDNETFLALSAFVKKSNETPVSEKNKAESRLQEYLERK